jgi:hypothetical protein
LTSIGRVLAYDFAIVGDDKPVALIDRPELADVFAEPDPAKQLAMYAALVVAIDHRISAIWRALEGAAASDPEAGRLYVAMVRQRRGSMQRQPSCSRTLVRCGRTSMPVLRRT